MHHHHFTCIIIITISLFFNGILLDQPIPTFWWLTLTTTEAAIIQNQPQRRPVVGQGQGQGKVLVHPQQPTLQVHSNDLNRHDHDHDHNHNHKQRRPSPCPSSPILTSPIRQMLYNGKRRTSIQYKSWAGAKGMLPLQEYCNPMDNEAFQVQGWLVKPFPPPASPLSSTPVQVQVPTSISVPTSIPIPTSNKERAEYKASLELDPNTDLKLIYIDSHIIVITKPSGLLSVPGPKRKPNTASLVHEHFIAQHHAQHHQSYENEDENEDEKENENENENENDVDGMIVHRLDMDTSGIIVYARNKYALSILHDAFRSKSASAKASAKASANTNTNTDRRKKQQRKKNTSSSTSSGQLQPQLQNISESQHVTKTYEALVCGHMPTMEGEIDLPLMRDVDHPPFMKVWNGQSKSNMQETVSQSISSSIPLSSSSSSSSSSSKTKSNLNSDSNESSNYLQKHRGYIKMMSKAPKESLTHYRVLSKEYMVVSDSQDDNDNDNGDGMRRQQQHQHHQKSRYLPVTRVELIPITGRTHQLRVHCAAIGHPIVGDNIYGFNGDGCPNGGFGLDLMMKSYPQMASLTLQGDIFQFVQQQRRRRRERRQRHHDKFHLSTTGDENGKTRNDEGQGHNDDDQPYYYYYSGDLCLHAKKLCIQHPITRAPMSFEADPPF